MSDSVSGKIVNKSELSLILGISEVSLTKWQQEDDGLPIVERGERGQANAYDTAAVIRWWMRRQLARAQASSPRDNLDRVRTEREQLALDRDRGALVRKSELRPLLERYVADVLAIIESIPDKYTPLLQQLPDADGKHQVMREMVREIREVLGSYEFGGD